jgi:hypothetical protein
MFLHRVWFNQLTLKILFVFIAGTMTLRLDDHVVHDHTTGRHLIHGLNRLCSSWVTNNSPLNLEHRITISEVEVVFVETGMLTNSVALNVALAALRRVPVQRHLVPVEDGGRQQP